MDVSQLALQENDTSDWRCFSRVEYSNSLYTKWKRASTIRSEPQIICQDFYVSNVTQRGFLKSPQSCNAKLIPDLFNIYHHRILQCVRICSNCQYKSNSLEENLPCSLLLLPAFPMTSTLKPNFSMPSTSTSPLPSNTHFGLRIWYAIRAHSIFSFAMTSWPDPRLQSLQPSAQAGSGLYRLRGSVSSGALRSVDEEILVC